MKEYYSDLKERERYLLYAQDGLDFSSRDKLYDSIWGKMNGNLEKFDKVITSPFKTLKGNSSSSEQIVTCKAFANYLWHKTR